MKRRNLSALATAVVALAIGFTAAAQTTEPPSADSGYVWSPQCGCTTKTFSRLAVTPARLPFTSRGKPATRRFNIANTGNAPLPILSYAMTDTMHQFWMAAAPPSFVIPPHHHVGVSVEFIPSAVGKFPASVTVFSAATRGAQNATVSMAGDAIKPAIAIPSANPTPSGQPTSTALISSLTPGAAAVNGAPFTMDIKGTGFDPNASVYWNSLPLPTTYVSTTELTASVPTWAISRVGVQSIGIESDGFAIGKPYTFLVGSSGGTNYAEIVIDTSANDLVYDPNRALIYLSISGSATANANSIAVLDLSSGQITNAVAAGSEPDVLAISDDGQYLYAGIDGQSSVQRFTLPSLANDISIPLGSNPLFGPYYAIDLQVAPANPQTIAISRAAIGISPAAYGGITIFDNTTARSTSVPGGANLYDSLQWGADATSLYAANTETSGDDFYTLAVDAGGVALLHDYSGAAGRAIHYNRGSGLIYVDDGFVLDPSNGSPAGRFSGGFGAMVPDSSINTAFFLNSTYQSLSSFNLTGFSSLSSISIPDATTSYQPVHVVRWGDNGIAFNARHGGPVYLIGGNFVH